VRALLDTHAMYWYIEGDPQLSTTARTIIRDASNEVLISPASYWEIAIKVSLGKWQLNRPYEDFVDLAVNKYKFTVLPILATHDAHLIGMPFHHKDPFDRMLAAQSLVEQVPIVGNDAAFDAYSVTRLW
jgi:PIN domain nuclease of toxin-antitoxin system